MEELQFPDGIRVEMESQVITMNDAARICIYHHDQLITEIIATVRPQQGANMGIYPCVILEHK